MTDHSPPRDAFLLKVVSDETDSLVNGAKESRTVLVKRETANQWAEKISKALENSLYAFFGDRSKEDTLKPGPAFTSEASHESVICREQKWPWTGLAP